MSRPGGRYAAWLTDVVSPVDRALSNPASLGAGADMIGFGGGQPAAEMYPLEALERAYSRAIRASGRSVLPYGPATGLAALRELIAERLGRRGVVADPANIVIMTGSVQSLHVIGRITLELGDTILTEGPTYLGAFATWEQQQPRYLTVPVDAHGLLIDRVRHTLATVAPLPKFIYLLPTFQNPSGVSLTMHRRQELLELAIQHDVLIVEDDPYGEFWFDPGVGTIPPVRSLPGAENHVIYLGTFSKILAPGIRLAYALVPPEMVPLLARAKRGVDFHTDTLLQQAVVNLVRDQDFDFEAHIAAGRGLYKERRDAMLDALEDGFSSDATWTRPAGGFFLWVDLPHGTSAEAVAQAAMAEGVAVFAGSLFYPNADGGSNGLRLSYSNTTPTEIQEGIRRLRRGFEAVTRR